MQRKLLFLLFLILTNSFAWSLNGVLVMKGGAGFSQPDAGSSISENGYIGFTGKIGLTGRFAISLDNLMGFWKSGNLTFEMTPMLKGYFPFKYGRFSLASGASFVFNRTIDIVAEFGIEFDVGVGFLLINYRTSWIVYTFEAGKNLSENRPLVVGLGYGIRFG